MTTVNKVNPIMGGLICCMLILAPSAGTVSAADDEKSAATVTEKFGYRLVKSLAAKQGDLSLIAVAEGVARAVEDSLLPEIWGDAPDWAKRIEFQWELNEDDKPEFSLLTVQPLYQSEGQRNTIFTQVRAAFHRQFGQDRYTSNIGLGYRRLFMDDSVLGGINLFHDYEWRNEQSRMGVGGELKWRAFDLTGNYYMGLSNKTTIAADILEQPLDGYNIELASQIPYLPWARARISKFNFSAEDATDDLDGYVASLELDVLPNLQVEMGYTDDDVGHNLGFVRMNFRLGDNLSSGPKGAYLISSKPIDSEPFRVRDMKAHTLDKVRRINEIVVERTSSGVTISRLN